MKTNISYNFQQYNYQQTAVKIFVKVMKVARFRSDWVKCGGDSHFRLANQIMACSVESQKWTMAKASTLGGVHISEVFSRC